MNEMYERNLPPYLAHDLEAWKKGVEEHSHFLDCLWGIANMIGLKSQATQLGIFTNGKKIGYVDFVRRHAGDFLASSLARIVPRIDLAAICAFIDDVPLLTDLQRQFYKSYLSARHEALFGRGEN